MHAPLIPPFGIELAAYALRKSGVAFLSPQLLDLLRWGRVLSTAKAGRLLGFRAARDTRAAFEEYISQRRVLRYEPDNQGYQYEKELEDFIHSRSPSPDNGGSPLARTSPLAGEVDGHRPAGGNVATRRAASASPVSPRPRPHRR
jgi:hypothetical protein